MALQALYILKKAKSLERMVALVGEGELSPENQRIYRTAKLIYEYMTQPFFVAEAQTGVPGKYVPLSETVLEMEKVLFDGYKKTTGKNNQ